MHLFALIFAVLLEQVRPLRPGNRVYALVRRAGSWCRESTDSGRSFDAALGWTMMVGGSMLAVYLLGRLAAAVHPVVLFALHVGSIYLCVGFRQFTHSFSAIQRALDRDEFERADRTLDVWLADSSLAGEADDRSPREPGSLRTPVQICRVAIVHALIACHRQVLAPILCYLLLPGFSGPVLYRVVEMLARRWRTASGPLANSGEPDSASIPDAGATHAAFAARAYALIDWIPVRITAACLAVAGDFEDATYCWRGAISAGTGDDQRAMLIAVGSGSLGLRLADPALERRWAEAVPVSFEWRAAEPDLPGIRSAVGLVWRATVMLGGLFALLSVSSWFSG